MTTHRGALRGAVPSHMTPRADALDLEALDPRRALEALTNTSFERAHARRDASPGPRGGEGSHADALDLEGLDPRAALDALTNTRFERNHARRGR